MKILIYPTEIENCSLGNMTKSLIDSGVLCFKVRITCLEFEIDEQDIEFFKETIDNKLEKGTFKINI